jgi:MFS family permease
MAPRIEQALGRPRALLLVVVVSALATATPGLTASALAVAATSVLAGAGSVVWNIITVSLRQRIAPDHLLGRVNAGYRLLAWGSMPMGALLGGILADLFGLRAAFLVAGVAALAAIPLLLSVVTPTALAAAESHPHQPEVPQPT